MRGDALGERRARRTVRLHTHRVDHRVRTTTVSQLPYHLGKIIFVLQETLAGASRHRGHHRGLGHYLLVIVILQLT